LKLNLSAMHRFSASSASSSPGRAEQSATASSSAGGAGESAASRRSAERPATSLNLKISSIRDVQAWLNGEQVAGCSSAGAQRIREAVAVLSKSKPRQEDVQPLQSKWQVAQKENKAKRPLKDVLQEFEGKVVKAAQNLQQQLAASAEQPALAGSSTDISQSNVARSSTIIAAQNASDNNFDSESLIPSVLNSSSLDDSSAARPAPKLDGPEELLRLQECNNCLRALPSQEVLQGKPLQRLQAAMALLQGRTSRQQRQEVQQLLYTWGVLQKAQGRKRKYDEVKADLVAKVVEETRRLKRMHDAFGGPSPDGSATNASARFFSNPCFTAAWKYRALPLNLSRQQCCTPCGSHFSRNTMLSVNYAVLI
jgi:hypothetical protein